MNETEKSHIPNQSVPSVSIPKSPVTTSKFAEPGVTPTVTPKFGKDTKESKDAAANEVQKTELLTKINERLIDANGESNIGLNDDYWTWLAQYRALNQNP